MTAVAPDTSFATRVEVRAQSLFLAAIVAFGILAFGQLMSINRELGALSATSATLVEQGRDHGNQLRDLDHRTAAVETQLKALTEAVNRIAPK
jgi:hypothetical protein